MEWSGVEWSGVECTSLYLLVLYKLWDLLTDNYNHTLAIQTIY